MEPTTMSLFQLSSARISLFQSQFISNTSLNRYAPVNWFSLFNFHFPVYLNSQFVKFHWNPSVWAQLSVERYWNFHVLLVLRLESFVLSNLDSWPSQLLFFGLGMELRKRETRLVSLGFSVLVFVNIVRLSSASVVYKPLSMAFADLPAKFGKFSIFVLFGSWENVGLLLAWVQFWYLIH